MSSLPSGPERRGLGLDRRITRRDFVNGVLAGSGRVLLLENPRDVEGPMQGATSRARFLATPYVDFELRVRRQMVSLFGTHGFEPPRDIAAIVNGKPSPLERVREGYGRVAIGHSELNGAQHWGSALEYGKRAGEKAAGML